MITGFAPRVSRDHLLRLTVLFLRVASLGAAVAYAVVGRKVQTGPRDASPPVSPVLAMHRKRLTMHEFSADFSRQARQGEISN